MKEIEVPSTPISYYAQPRAGSTGIRKITTIIATIIRFVRESLKSQPLCALLASMLLPYDHGVDAKREKRISKFLSLILRHQPERIGINLDEEGWAIIDELLDASARKGQPLSRDELDQVVANNDKQRFAISEDGTCIRAQHGHSRPVALGYQAEAPPEILFHGTAAHKVDAILREGLLHQGRQFVHLSIDEITAVQVGGRHGKPVILRVKSGDMHRDGMAFMKSPSGVWLTEHVPAAYIQGPSADS